MLDATGIESSEELIEAYAFLHPVIGRMMASGRVIVLGTPPEQCGQPAAAIAQRALEGLTRAIGKEVRKGATAQLIYVAPKAEAQFESTLRFFLSPKSAFVSGQVVRIGRRVARAGRIAQRITEELLARELVRANGRIVGVSSISGIAGKAGQTNYSTSKAGVIGMVQATAPAPAAPGADDERLVSAAGDRPGPYRQPDRGAPAARCRRAVRDPGVGDADRAPPPRAPVHDPDGGPRRHRAGVGGGVDESRARPRRRVSTNPRGTAPSDALPATATWKPILLPATVQFAEVSAADAITFGVRDTARDTQHLDGLLAR